VHLTRTTSTQVGEGVEIPKDMAQMVPGDLVFFYTRGRVTHVALYMGDGQMVHAPRPGAVVRVQSLAEYPNKNWTVRRVG
jgi:cell wall-associated NlpC family hydrolase